MVGLGDGSIITSDAGVSVAEIRFGGGDATSWMRVGCVPSSAWSWAEGDFPSDGDSLAHISIS